MRVRNYPPRKTAATARLPSSDSNPRISPMPPNVRACWGSRAAFAFTRATIAHPDGPQAEQPANQAATKGHDNAEQAECQRDLAVGFGPRRGPDQRLLAPAGPPAHRQRLQPGIGPAQRPPRQQRPRRETGRRQRGRSRSQRQRRGRSRRGTPGSGGRLLVAPPIPACAWRHRSSLLGGTGQVRVAIDPPLVKPDADRTERLATHGARRQRGHVGMVGAVHTSHQLLVISC